MENNLITGLQVLAGAEHSNTFINDLRLQNKAKSWDLNPIKINIEKGLISHNAEDIKKAIETLETTLKTTLEDTNSIDVVDGLNENLKIVTDWLKGTRLQVTEPFNKLKSSFTANERILKDLTAVIKTKKDELLEETYKKARIKIFQELQVLADELIENSEIPILLKQFEDFAEVKKKLKSMIPNEKGKLGAASMKQIKEQFDMVANPLIEAKRIAEVKEKEHNILTQQLSNIITTGTDEVLNNSITSLNQMHEQTAMYFSNIEDSAKSQIKSTIAMIEANIRANETANKEVIQRQKDQELLKQFDDENFKSDNISILTGILNNLKEIFVGEMVYFKDDAKKQLQKLNDKIEAIKKTELEAAREVQTVETAPKEEVTHEQKTEQKTFKLSQSDIEFIANTIVSAKNEDEAKEMLISSILCHIDMTELEEV